MIQHRSKFILCLVVLTLLLTGCADHVEFADAAAYGKVGFWFGVWHGAILPIAWLMSVFNPDVAIYAIYNDGVWYDSGYMIGVGSLVLAAMSLNSL